MRIFHITDTHLSIDDERGEKYLEYSERMAGAYKSNSHFVTQKKYTTQESFELTLQLAKDEDADFLALTGDIFSFPSVIIEPIMQTSLAPQFQVGAFHTCVLYLMQT